MPNLEEVVSENGSPLRHPPKIRPANVFRRYWDLAAVLLLMAASLPLPWISPRTVILVQRPGTFDEQWVLDSAFKATQGTIFGRDVAFVYGPIFQWLLAAPERWSRYPMADTYVSYRTLLLWCGFLFTYATLRLLLREQPPWKRFLLLLLLAVFWTPWDGRTAFAIFLFALFLRGWYAVSAQRIGRLVFGCGSSLLATIAFLYSADTGVYAVAAWVLGACGVAWERRRESPGLKISAAAGGGFALSLGVLVLLVNWIMASPLDFRFWRTSLALVGVHRWNEPYPLSTDGAIHLLAPLVIGALLFVARRIVPADRTEVLAARPGFLLSAFAFALLCMQSGLVRSDYNHIVFGVYPMVLFVGVVVFSFRSRLMSAATAVTAIVCSFFFSEPAPQFRPSSLRFRLARIIQPIAICPGGYRDIDHACYPAQFAGTLQAAVGYLQKHSAERDSVLIFPYQYMYGVAAQRNVAAGVEQSFLANGKYLSEFDIAGMQQARAQVGLYFPDQTADGPANPNLSLQIDGISNFTRTPSIWFWMFRHYSSDLEIAPGIVPLLRDESRDARISMEEYPLSLPADRYAISTSSQVIGLGAPLWPANGADFLRLRMRVNYSPLWKLRKPERLGLEITLADGTRTLRTLVAEPNVMSEIWIYPWREADLSRYFDSDERRWRVSPRPAVTDLRLVVSPFDWFSQKPESITLQSADAVRLSLKQQQTITNR
ncbi:MAG TPA: hypothetical protein VKB58_15475 [Terriglobales bacterium]|nr:hypothetical protein [Terriglobales bacterium]